MGGSPATSGEVRDFTSPLHYIVESSDNLVTKDYTVTVNVTPASSAKDLLTFGLPNNHATITGTTIALTVPFGTDVTNLSPTYTVSQFAAGAPATGTAVNFATQQTYTVTAQDGSTQVYIVTVTVAPYSGVYAVNYNGTYQGGTFNVTGPFGPTVASTATYWNNINPGKDVNSHTPGDFTVNILDSNGVNPISLFTDDNGVDGGHDGQPPPPPTNNFENLFFTGIRDGDVSWNIKTTVVPFITYDVYIYAFAGRRYGVNNGNTTTWTAGSYAPSFVLGQNYQVFTGLSGPLNIRVNDGIRGFAIVNTFTPTDEYTIWADANITAIDAGADATPTGDPDKDGQNNLLEFALNGNPLSGYGLPKIYVMVADSGLDVDNFDELILTVAFRAGAPSFVVGVSSTTATHGGITYAIEGALDLTFQPTEAMNVLGAPITNPEMPPAGAGYEYLSFRLSSSNQLPGKGFVRARITMP